MRDKLILVGVICVSTVILWVGAGFRTIYQNFDGPYYAVVAKCGYNKECIGNNFSFPLPLEYYPAHLPAYPALIKIFSFAGSLRAAVGINLLATILAALVLYRLVERNKWGNPLWLSLAWLFIWPRMWVVRSVGSPETLFALFILTSIYFFVEKKYWLAGIAGALAVLTKSPGILLFIAYCLVPITYKKRAWPILLIPLALVGLFGLYQYQMGDFWAYFHSGDNIHLQALPFKIFDSNQSWVGTFWLEDVLWVYLIGLIGIWRAYRKSPVLGTFGAVFLTTIFFVSHRDISRYSLPIVPVVLVGLSEIFERREVRWGLALLVVPIFFYSLNFLSHNTLAIADWKPFLQTFSR